MISFTFTIFTADGNSPSFFETDPPKKNQLWHRQRRQQQIKGKSIIIQAKCSERILSCFQWDSQVNACQLHYCFHNVGDVKHFEIITVINECTKLTRLDDNNVPFFAWSRLCCVEHWVSDLRNTVQRFADGDSRSINPESQCCWQPNNSASLRACHLSCFLIWQHVSFILKGYIRMLL